MNATTLSPATKFHCLRRGLPMPPDPVTATRLIPVVQTDIARHLQHQASSCTPQSGDHIEWKNILEDLQDFLTDLQKLAAPPQTQTADNPSIMSAESTKSTESTPSTDPAPPAAILPAPTTKEEHAAWIAAGKARCAARKQQKPEQKPAEKISHAASASNVEPEAVPCET